VTAAPAQGDEDRFQLWTVERSNGNVSRLTNDLSSYGRVTATSDGRALLAVQGDTLQDIWVSPASEVGSATRVTATSVHSPRISVAWTPEGRLVYSEAAGEYRELWMVDADGGNRKRLTSGPTNKDEAAVSPDGRYIVYLQNGNVWRMDANGANPRQLTYGPLDVHPDVTTDSRTVVYASFVDWSPGIVGEPTLWQVPIGGGKPIQIVKQPASFPQVSPDGKRIACVYFPARDPRFPPFFVGVVGPQAHSAFSVLQGSPSDETRVFWEPDGKAVDYIVNTGRVGNIWRQPLANRPATPLTDFTTDDLFTFAWSRDGRRLAYARGRTSSSVVRIDGF
jgi:Tol biopolymer transport system component